MSWGFAIWCGLGVFVGVTWIVRRIVMGVVLRKDAPLGPDSWGSPPTPAPRLSVLVAAKDEEDNIESCVTSLLEQDYPDFEIIVIDDRSTDDTPNILKRLQREAGDKLRVITVHQLPDGWFGKNHAMHRGVKISRAEWLCFTDADCRYTSRRALSMTVRQAAEDRTDFLSLTPVMQIERAWEHVILPVCAAVLILWFKPRRVNDPTTPTAYANGAFMLVNRRCYEAVGGHERVRGEINEDTHMARNAKQLGFRLKVMRNDGLYVARMYATPREAWRGWSRILYGTLESRARIVIAAGFIMVFTLFPWISLATAAWGWLLGQPSVGDIWFAATVFWSAVVAVQLWSVSRWYSIVKSKPRWCPAYVLGAVVTLGMLIDAFFKVSGLRHTIWRGTRYRRGKRVKDRTKQQLTGESQVPQCECDGATV